MSRSDICSATAMSSPRWCHGTGFLSPRTIIRFDGSRCDADLFRCAQGNSPRCRGCQTNHSGPIPSSLGLCMLKKREPTMSLLKLLAGRR